MYLRLVVLCVHVPQVGGIVCTCAYLRLVVLRVHVPQVGGIVCWFVQLLLWFCSLFPFQWFVEVPPVLSV